MVTTIKRVLSTNPEREPELVSAGAVHLSNSGQLSVTLDEVRKTSNFKRDLEVLKRVAAARRKAGPTARGR